MPAFSRLQDRYAAHGVQFVGIALDSADSVQAFAERSPVSYPLLVGGPEGVVLAQALGNSSLSLPYTLVLSPQREPRLVRMGPVSEGELERILAMARSP
jgi:peroxiredoxin